MEVRVFMYYVNNDEMNELMKQENVDFHGEAAKIAFNIEESDPQFKFFRQLAKSITFGVIYGIGRDKLSMQLNTTPVEAANYKATYLNNMKGSKRFFDAVVRTIKTRGTVRSRYGRIYKVPSDFAYRGVNYLIQGTSADIMSERMVEVHKYLDDKKSNLLLQVHDEIICEIHEDEFDDVAPKVKDLMIENTLNIPLEVDMEICDPSWAIKKDVADKDKFKLEEHIDWD
jgi:DNA polymerase-1